MVLSIDGIRNESYPNEITPFGMFSSRIVTYILKNPSPAVISIIIVATLIFINHKRHSILQSESPVLNRDVLKKLFMEIELNKLNSCAMVCKEWNLIVNDPSFIKENIYQKFAFGPLHWNEFYGVNTISNQEMREAYQLLNFEIFKILKSKCPAFPKKRIMDTHMLVWIPKKIKGKDLTILSFRELQKYQYIWKSILKGVAKLPVESGWVLYATNILPDSMNKSYDEQQSYVESFNKNGNINWRVPKLAEAAVCISAKFLKQEKSKREDVYTRVYESVESFQLMAGDFNLSGLYLGCSNSKCSFIGINSYSNVAVRNKAS